MHYTVVNVDGLQDDLPPQEHTRHTPIRLLDETLLTNRRDVVYQMGRGKSFY